MVLFDPDWYQDTDLMKYEFYSLVGNGNIKLGQVRKRIFYLEREIKEMEDNVKRGCKRIKGPLKYKKNLLKALIKKEKYLNK